MLPAHSSDCPTPALQSHETKSSPFLCKGLAKHSKCDRTSSVLVQLSPREQQVFWYRNQGFSFEDISLRLCCPLTVVLGYYRRALTKLERKLCTQSTQDLAKALTPVTLEQAFIKLTHQRQSSVSDRPAPALGLVPVEHPNSLDLYVSSFFVTGDRLGCSEADVSVAVDLALRSLDLSTKRPPRQRRRKRSNRRSRQMGVGFRVAAAS